MADTLVYSTSTPVKVYVEQEYVPGPTCPTRTPEVHELGEFPMDCYRCHIHADS